MHIGRTHMLSNNRAWINTTRSKELWFLFSGPWDVGAELWVGMYV